MVQWVVGSILHGGDPLSYFSFQPVLHDWCNKGHGMYYHVCGMMHIKEPLLLLERVAYVVTAGFLSRYMGGPSFLPSFCCLKTHAGQYTCTTFHSEDVNYTDPVFMASGFQTRAANDYTKYNEFLSIASNFSNQKM